MSLVWRYGGAVAILVSIVVAMAIVDAASLEGGAFLVVFLGLPAATLVAVEGLKRLTWDGSHSSCAGCGAVVRSYRRYCEDCERTRTGGGGGL